MKKHFFLALTANLLLALPGISRVDAGCCDRCGASCTTRLVCRTICTTKIVESTFWDEQCETICMPPKSMDATGCLAGLSGDSCPSYNAWEPCDASDAYDQCSGRTPLLASLVSVFRHPDQCHLRDRHKLIRKSYVQYVPTLECVVEQLCAGCCGEVTSIQSPDEPGVGPIQPEPPVNALPPVRLQISDQLEDEGSNPLSPFTGDGLGLEGVPSAGQSLAPIAPVIHIQSR